MSQSYRQNYERTFGSKRRKRRGGSCRCPSGAKMVSTRGFGRGFVCQARTKKVVRKRGRTWVIKKPFVRAIGC